MSDEIKELEKDIQEYKTDVHVECTNIYDFQEYARRGYKDIQFTRTFFIDICERLQTLTELLKFMDGAQIKKGKGKPVTLKIFKQEVGTPNGK